MPVKLKILFLSLPQVVVLRSLRSKLSEALAEIHSTASALHLRIAKHEEAGTHEDHSSPAADGSHTGRLFQQARQAIVQTCNSCTQVHPSTAQAELISTVLRYQKMHLVSASTASYFTLFLL